MAESDSIAVLKIFIALLLLLPTACSQQFANTTPKVPGAKLTQKFFISFDGTPLPLQVWLPGQTIQAAIVSLHGFNDYANFIGNAAKYFRDNEIAVYSYDQRGFGRTPHRGYWYGTKALSLDLATLIPLIREKHPGIPIFVLGDSMGGAVVIAAFTSEAPIQVDGVILVAPAVWSRSMMPFYQRWLLWLAAHTIPWKTVTGKSLDIVASDNDAMLKELGQDNLVIKETRIDTLYGLTHLMDIAFQRSTEFRARTLMLYGLKDEIIPSQPVLNVFQRIPGTVGDEKRLMLYNNGYHMLLRDLQAETVLKDIVTWIRDPNRTLPSTVNGQAEESIL